MSTRHELRLSDTFSVVPAQFYCNRIGIRISLLTVWRICLADELISQPGCPGSAGQPRWNSTEGGEGEGAAQGVLLRQPRKWVINFAAVLTLPKSAVGIVLIAIEHNESECVTVIHRLPYTIRSYWVRSRDLPTFNKAMWFIHNPWYWTQLPPISCRIFAGVQQSSYDVDTSYTRNLFDWKRWACQ